jgi:hypothetical protein
MHKFYNNHSQRSCFMKALQIITALTITTSFSLYSMDENEEYIGLRFYHGEYHQSFCHEGRHHCGSTIYSYCTSNQKDAHTCDVLNAYLLLNRRPQESVEEQVKFYSELNSTNDIFRKKDLNLRQSLLQRVIPQIQRARLSGNLQDASIQQQVDTSLKNTLSSYNQKMRFMFNQCNFDYTRELIYLRTAVQRANDCKTVDPSCDAFYNPNSYMNSNHNEYDCLVNKYKDALYRKEENKK